MKSKVVLLRCPDYDGEKIKEELRWGMAQLGGVERFFSREEKILLKPNLLRKAAPESAVVTHPAVVSAMAELLLEAGCRKLSYGDSVGVGSMEKIAEGCGLADAMKELAIPMAILMLWFGQNTRKGRWPDGSIWRRRSQKPMPF